MYKHASLLLAALLMVALGSVGALLALDLSWFCLWSITALVGLGIGWRVSGQWDEEETL